MIATASCATNTLTPRHRALQTSRLFGTRGAGQRRGVPKGIPREAWAQHADCDGGEVALAEISLCSMVARKAADGYYHVHESFSLVAQGQ